jgi:hypothetical protein
MAEFDLVVSDLKITKEGVFDFNELYKTVKSWLEFHKYDFFEKNYEDITKTESKNVKIKFEAERKIDDYHKFGMEITLKVGDHKIVVSHDKKKKLVQGSLVISINAGIASDIGSEWEDKPVKKFFRGIYDKYVQSDKRMMLNNELKEDTSNLYNEIKAFLNLQRF